MKTEDFLNPGDKLIVTMDCGLCKASMVEDMTEFIADNKIDFTLGIVPPEATEEFMKRRGADFILGHGEIIIRCSRCKKLGITSRQHMTTIPQVEYERLLEIERKYEEGDESKDDDE